MKTISFYSYKGGVGRSLALTNLAAYLVQFGATVAIIDFDLEAPGLQYKISPGRDPVDVGDSGIVRLMAQASRANSSADLDYRLAIDVTDRVLSDRIEVEPGQLLLVPAGDPLRTAYWRDLNSIDWSSMFDPPNRLGANVLGKIRQQLVDDYQPDVLLIDSRTGITPVGGVATTLLPDVVVLMLLNNREHLDGTRVVAEAILSQGTDAPAIVPVLSRYTSTSLAQSLAHEELRRWRARSPVYRRAAAEYVPEPEVVPADEIYRALVAGLSVERARCVDSPLVLHTDLELQQREQLAFGPNVQDLRSNRGSLLDDYIRLFARLVPVELINKHLAGVRSKVRASVLDNPDDALRILDNLASTVGDEGVFMDLVKLHALRGDTVGMVSAAERLFRLHQRIVVDPALSSAFLRLLSESGPRRQSSFDADPEFALAYWKAADPSDADWGMLVALALLDSGRLDVAESIATELHEEVNVLAISRFIRRAAAGPPESEGLAIRIAADFLDSFGGNSDYLAAAHTAWRYRPDPDLAHRIVNSVGFPHLPPSSAVELLASIGHVESALTVLSDATLAASDEVDGPSDLDDLQAAWRHLAGSHASARAMLRDRFPDVLALLESRASH